MTKEEIKKNLLTMRNLQERWKYKSVRGARRRVQYDRKFPEPIVVMGNGAKLFWLPDIEEHEKLRGEIDVTQSRYTFYESKEEWKTKTREEKEKQRGVKYSDRESEEIENES